MAPRRSAYDAVAPRVHVRLDQPQPHLPDRGRDRLRVAEHVEPAVEAEVDVHEVVVREVDPKVLAPRLGGLHRATVQQRR